MIDQTYGRCAKCGGSLLADHTCPEPLAGSDRPSKPASLRGRCFKVLSSYGDDRPEWWTFRRVLLAGSEMVECYRFEIRSNFGNPLGELAVRFSDPIRKDLLLQQTEITSEEWNRELEAFRGWINEPWDCE